MPNIIDHERTEFQKHTGVSYETIHRLDRYAELLREWNQKFNLVAESTLPHIWSRHFLDSAQLMRFIPERTEILADLGSGAGFPGLVLSILGVPGVTLIEATGKKADFLRNVVADLGLQTIIRQARIEDIRDTKADIITARALKPLKELFKLASPLMRNDSIGLFLKGRNLEDELTKSAQWWKFSHEKSRSISDPSGNVLIVKDLQYKNATTRKPHKHKR